MWVLIPRELSVSGRDLGLVGAARWLECGVCASAQQRMQSERGKCLLLLVSRGSPTQLSHARELQTLHGRCILGKDISKKFFTRMNSCFNPISHQLFEVPSQHCSEVHD